MRRSREEITAAVLKACVVDKLTINQLIASQNLSHRQLRSYLDRLTALDLIEYETEGRRKLVHTSSRGVNVLKCYRNAIALLNGHPANCPLISETSESAE